MYFAELVSFRSERRDNFCRLLHPCIPHFLERPRARCCCDFSEYSNKDRLCHPEWQSRSLFEYSEKLKIHGCIHESLTGKSLPLSLRTRFCSSRHKLGVSICCCGDGGGLHTECGPFMMQFVFCPERNRGRANPCHFVRLVPASGRREAAAAGRRWADQSVQNRGATSGRAMLGFGTAQCP